MTSATIMTLISSYFLCASTTIGFVSSFVVNVAQLQQQQRSSVYTINYHNQCQRNRPFRRWVNTLYMSEESADDGEEKEQGLVLGDKLQSHMSGLRSKYPTSENAFLAAARERAKNKKESADRKASDKDWSELAKDNEAKFGKEDAWEASAKEAGNADSQVLFHIEEVSDENDDDDGEAEPKLLLF